MLFNRDKLAAAIGIPKEKQQIFDIGSDHSYNCKCQTCKKWWQYMGPEDADKPYGPFDISEIEDGSEEGYMCQRTRLRLEEIEHGKDIA